MSYVIPAAIHFTDRLKAFHRDLASSPRRLTLLSELVADLKLWQTFISAVEAGHDINQLVHRLATDRGHSDACEFGLGGFWDDGLAWWLFIPEHL